jgi:hypothetical protein
LFAHAESFNKPKPALAVFQLIIDSFDGAIYVLAKHFFGRFFVPFVHFVPFRGQTKSVVNKESLFCRPAYSYAGHL